MAYAPRILVVEDELLLRQLFHHVLSQDGYYVTAVATGRHAVRLVSETPFDLALVDMSLPDLDGPEVIRQILIEHPSLKAIALSGAMGHAMSSVAARAGAAETAQKPITPAQLCDLVYRLLDPSLSWRNAAI